MVIDMNKIKGKTPDMKLKGFYTVCDTPDYKVGTTVRDIDSAGNPPPDYREFTVDPDAPDFSFSGSINGTKAVALISYKKGKVTRVQCGNEQLTDKTIIDQAQELVDNHQNETD